MDNQTASDEILELVACDCKNGKCTERCKCDLLQVRCKDICKCKGDCHNEVPESFFISDEDEELEKHIHT